MKKNSMFFRILNYPLTRIIVGISVIVAIVAIGQIGIRKLFDLFPLDRDIEKLVEGIIIAVLAIYSYILVCKFYEKRVITEISRKQILKNLAIGMALGSVLQSLTILVIYLNGSYSVLSINPITFIIPPLTIAFTSAIFEEILLRGIIFRIMEERLGSYLALGISAIIFGGMHLLNPNSSVIVGIGLAIQAGLLLGAAYIFARNLWFPIAIHFAWNFTQAAIFGANVSGNAISKTLISSNIQGAKYITGGEFGPEGSIQATLFCLTATIILIVLSKKRGNLISWHSKKQS